MSGSSEEKRSSPSRRLFDQSDGDESTRKDSHRALAELRDEQLEKCSAHWNFDFKKGEPLPGKWDWRRTGEDFERETNGNDDNENNRQTDCNSQLQDSESGDRFARTIPPAPESLKTPVNDVTSLPDAEGAIAGAVSSATLSPAQSTETDPNNGDKRRQTTMPEFYPCKKLKNTTPSSVDKDSQWCN